MSRWAKICWLVAGLSFAGVLVTRFILSGWIDVLWVPLGVSVVCFIAAILLDARFYLEFLTLKTTKNGMNMGVLILLVLALLVAVNFLSVQHDKSWDVTEEKLNSLADQSLSVLKNLKDDVNVLIFYRGEKDRNEKEKVRMLLSLYKDQSPHIKVRYINAYVRASEAAKYLTRGDGFTVFVEQKGRKVKVESPYQEEQFTTALIKVAREKSKIVYFLKGHGERSLESADPEGIKDFKQALLDSSFQVKELSLITGEALPKDAAMIAIVGPFNQIMDAEVKELEKYLRNGGRLMVAVDPGQRHHISPLLKKVGLDFKNNFILNDQIRIMGQGMATILGMVYDATHPITKKFETGRSFTLFRLASEIAKASDAPSDFQYVELVRTPPSSFAAKSLNVKRIEAKRRMFSLAVSMKGHLKTGDQKDKKASDKEFSVVAFGDSDFLSNEYFLQGLNRDLALNTVAYLTEESDLISIRPKQPKGTKMTLTPVKQNTLVVAGVVIPFIFMILSGLFWYRRRNA
ncbi:MAG: hypothetical protein D6797_02910 [Bdellovibrio sp.]|nr:MAG: hypothetical protein D6797_02910 [Bdellovibrio sp.]